MMTNFTDDVQRADGDTDDKVRGGRWAEGFAVLEHIVTATAELTDVVASEHKESTGCAADDQWAEGFAVLEHTVTATAELTDVVASKHEESTGRAADDHACEHSGTHTRVLEA